MLFPLLHCIFTTDSSRHSIFWSWGNWGFNIGHEKITCKLVNAGKDAYKRTFVRSIIQTSAAEIILQKLRNLVDFAQGYSTIKIPI